MEEAISYLPTFLFTAMLGIIVFFVKRIMDRIDETHNDLTYLKVQIAEIKTEVENLKGRVE